MEHMKLAFTQYGVKEITGSVDNPKIVQYFDDLGFNGSELKDETAWCSAFANWVCKFSNLPYSGKLNARSWNEIGNDVVIPELGDIVVLWRVSKSSWKGHVGFYINHDEKHVYMLGGNQGNKVCIAPYSIDRVLTYRRLT
jgi:uncharacterized protein (TIGR02594 family)